jgi:hypothetical protein
MGFVKYSGQNVKVFYVNKNGSENLMVVFYAMTSCIPFQNVAVISSETSVLT